MITINKFGKGKFGNWALFTYSNIDFSIKGIANTKLELEAEKEYNDLYLEVVLKNGKIYYNIIEK